MTLHLRYDNIKLTSKGRRDYFIAFNEFINAKRKELNMTVDELVEKSGIPKGTLSKITAGINNNPTLATVEALCNALNCSLDDAVGFTTKANDFSYEEINHIKKYRALDERGKKVVDLVLDEEYEQSQKPVHILQAVARGGAYIEKELTDEQVKDIDKLLEEIPPEYDENI